MVKSELINLVVDKQDMLPHKDVELCINYILDCMSQSLSDNHRIEIRGFGSFCLHYRPPRTAHNPKTREKLVTEAKYTPHFKPGKELRDRVNASRHQVEIKEEHRTDEDDHVGFA